MKREGGRKEGRVESLCSLAGLARLGQLVGVAVAAVSWSGNCVNLSS